MKRFKIRYKQNLPTYYVGDKTVPAIVFADALKRCERAGMKRVEDYTTQNKFKTIAYEYITYE